MIQTPYLIVTSSITLLKQLMDEGLPYAEVIVRLKDSNALLFTNTGNNNFLSFKATSDTLGINSVLKLVDPEQEFEERLIAGGLLDVYNGYTRAKKPHAMWSSDGAAGEAIERSQKLKESQPSMPTPQLYIAFGTGPDVGTWAPPMRYVITNFNIDFSEGKVVTLNLATTKEQFDIKTDFPSMGISVYAEGRSRNINLAIDREPIYSYINPDGDREPVSPEFISFHGIICDAIRDLASKLDTGNNVMVLLPNVDRVCREAIFEVKRKTLKDDSRSKNNEKFVEEVLSMFGLTLVRQTNLVETAEAARQVEPAPQVRVFNEAEKALNRQQRIQRDYEKTTFYASIKAFAPVNGVEPNILEAISYVYGKIRERMTEVKPMNRFAYRAEGDEDILKLWSAYSVSGRWPLFQLSMNGPVMVLGDEGMISRNLYAKKQDIYETDPLLHPADQDAFGGFEDVFAAVSDAAFRALSTDRDRKNDPFFGLYLAPKELSSPSKQSITPFFKYGVAGGNVLEVKGQFDKALYGAIQMGFRQQYDRVTSAVAKGILPQGFVSFPADTAERRDFFDRVVTEEQKAEAELGAALFLGNTERLLESGRKLRASQALYNFQRFNVPVGQIQAEITKLPDGIHEAIAVSASQKARSAEIITIPYFHLFGSKALYQQVGLVTSAPTITQTETKQPQALSRFLTGLYFITGVEHTMDSSSARSRFMLAKLDPPSNAADKTEKEKKAEEQSQQSAVSNDLPKQEPASVSIADFDVEAEQQRIKVGPGLKEKIREAIIPGYKSAAKVKRDPGGYWARTSAKLNKWWNSDWTDMGGLDG